MAVATISENVTTQQERLTPRKRKATRREVRLSEGRKGRKGAGPARKSMHIATSRPTYKIRNDD